MKIVIYKITILTTNKSYIGETNNIVRRISQHKHSAKNRCTHRKGMYIDWISGGINNFSVEVLETFDFISKEDTWDKEAKYISKYNTDKVGYNIAYRSSSVANSKRKGIKLSPEICRKLSEAHRNVSGSSNPAANRYYIVDNSNKEYVCECREDIARQLSVSIKQAKRIIANIGEWYTIRIHEDDRYVSGKSFKLLKIEKIN